MARTETPFTTKRILRAAAEGFYGITILQCNPDPFLPNSPSIIDPNYHT